MASMMATLCSRKGGLYECVFNIISTCKSLYSCIAMTTVLHFRASMYTLCPHPILNCCITFFDICYLTKFGSLGHFNSIHHRRVYLSWRLTQEEHFREILTTMLICNYMPKVRWKCILLIDDYDNSAMDYYNTTKHIDN